MEQLVRELWDVFMPVVSMLLVTIAVPAVAALTWKGLQKLGVDISAEQRNTYQSALENAAGLIVQRLGPRAAGLKNLPMMQADPVVRAAIERVQAGAPDGIAKWQITPSEIARDLEAKLGLQTGPADGAAGPRAPVT